MQQIDGLKCLVVGKRVFNIKKQTRSQQKRKRQKMHKTNPLPKFNFTIMQTEIDHYHQITAQEKQG